MTEKVATPENFSLLLSWLDPNVELAAEKYEALRTRLIRLFTNRGCHEADYLADETINRVTLKISSIKEDYVGSPSPYFYAVAGNVHLEWLRSQKKARPVELKEDTRAAEQPIEANASYDCLEKCLDKLPASLRELIIEYYRGEKREKIDHHKFLADKWSLSINALQTKTCRIRTTLRKCVTECLAGA